MGLFEILFVFALVLLVSFQVWLTSRVFKSTMYERRQKVLQAQLIWFLPVLGAGIVFSILEEDRRADKHESTQSNNS